jgi:hypothetical protein
MPATAAVQSGHLSSIVLRSNNLEIEMHFIYSVQLAIGNH